MGWTNPFKRDDQRGGPQGSLPPTQVPDYAPPPRRPSNTSLPGVTGSRPSGQRRTPHDLAMAAHVLTTPRPTSGLSPQEQADADMAVAYRLAMEEQGRVQPPPPVDPSMPVAMVQRQHEMELAAAMAESNFATRQAAAFENNLQELYKAAVSKAMQESLRTVNYDDILRDIKLWTIDLAAATEEVSAALAAARVRRQAVAARLEVVDPTDEAKAFKLGWLAEQIPLAEARLRDLAERVAPVGVAVAELRELRQHVAADAPSLQEAEARRDGIIARLFVDMGRAGLGDDSKRPGSGASAATPHDIRELVAMLVEEAQAIPAPPGPTRSSSPSKSVRSVVSSRSAAVGPEDPQQLAEREERRRLRHEERRRRKAAEAEAQAKAAAEAEAEAEAEATAKVAAEAEAAAKAEAEAKVAKAAAEAKAAAKAAAVAEVEAAAEAAKAEAEAKVAKAAADAEDKAAKAAKEEAEAEAAAEVEAAAKAAAETEAAAKAVAEAQAAAEAAAAAPSPQDLPGTPTAADASPPRGSGSARSAVSPSTPTRPPSTRKQHPVRTAKEFNLSTPQARKGSSGVKPVPADSIRRMASVVSLHYELMKDSGVVASAVGWEEAGKGKGGRLQSALRRLATVTASGKRAGGQEDATSPLPPSPADLDSFHPQTMEEVVTFVAARGGPAAGDPAEPGCVKDSLAAASQEQGTSKWATLCAAAAMHTALAHVVHILQDWVVSPAVGPVAEAHRLADFMAEVTAVAGRVTQAHGPLRARMARHGVPWDEGALTEVRWAAQGAAAALMGHALDCAEDSGKVKGSWKREAVLQPLGHALMGAFPVHQFAGGFSSAAAALAEELVDRTVHYARLVDPKWLRSTRLVAA